jgi:hypothetical protein
MISFKSFVQAIHDAILQANSKLIDKNQDVIDKYFEEVTTPSTSQENSDGTTTTTPAKTVLTPKTTVLEYPHLDSEGKLLMTEISVPLITLSPLNLSQIDKVTLTSEFEMQMNGDELEIEFSNRPNTSGSIFSKPKETKTGKIEIVIKPQETAEGLKILVEAYENVLKRQL